MDSLGPGCLGPGCGSPGWAGEGECDLSVDALTSVSLNPRRAPRLKDRQQPYEHWSTHPMLILPLSVGKKLALLYLVKISDTRVQR